MTVALDEVSWDSARCASIGTDVFFEDGDPHNVRELVCASCPIKQKCLDYALDNEESFGIWGGLTPRQRLRVLRERYNEPEWRWSRASVCEEYIPKYCNGEERHLVEGRNVFIDHRGSRMCLKCHLAARNRADEQRRGVA